MSLRTSGPVRLTPDQDIHQVGNNLYGFRALWLKTHLHLFLAQCPPFWQRRKPEQSVGLPGALYKYKEKDETTGQLEEVRAPKIFLTEVCQAVKITAFTGKEDVIRRLHLHFARDPNSLVPEIRDHLSSLKIAGTINHYFDSWESASFHDMTLKQQLDRIGEDVVTVNMTVFPDHLRQLASKSYGENWYPTTKTLFVFGREFNSLDLLHASGIDNPFPERALAGLPATVAAAGPPTATSVAGLPAAASAAGFPPAVSAAGPPAMATAAGLPAAAMAAGPPDAASAVGASAPAPGGGGGNLFGYPARGRKTNGCMLRLMKILFLVDEVYKMLMLSKTDPPRRVLDRGATGPDADIWQVAHQYYIDDDFPIPDLPVNVSDETVKDPKTGMPYDDSRCLSKWATPADLRTWYNDSTNKFATFYNNHDTSGQHDFMEENGFVEFCDDFCFGQKGPIFLGVLSRSRGLPCVRFHGGKVPERAQVDGLQPRPQVDVQEPRPTAQATTRTGRRKGQRKARVSVGSVEEEPTTAAVLGSFLDKFATPSQPPRKEKRECMEERIKFYKSRADDNFYERAKKLRRDANDEPDADLAAEMRKKADELFKKVFKPENASTIFREVNNSSDDEDDDEDSLFTS